jgi:Fe-coproporphyrin III synthase
MNKILEMMYLGGWFVDVRLFARQKPLQTVLFITDKCNLRCRHCGVYNIDNPIVKSYNQVEDELRYSYELGSRFIDFEGGEPTIWRDGDKTVNDLIRLAKEIGFFSTTITTNAQGSFAGSLADSIWVSLDGTEKFHDEIRGAGAFKKLEKNIAESHHKNLNVNMTINSLNYTNVRDTVNYAKDNPAIKLISLNFHTPYKGTESLFLDWDKRVEIIDLLISMKKAKYPIMNSVSGLEFMKHNNFERQCWVTNYILPDGTLLNECVGKTMGMCDKCGFCMAGEMRSVFDFKIDTLLDAVKLRV